MAKDVCVRLGERVRALRIEQGWTQMYLSVYTGLSRTFISDIELGRKEPCLRSLEVFAVAFKVSLSQLMKGV